jgi:hypothetical protein
VNRKLGSLLVLASAAMALFALSAFATDAQMYFSSDRNGQSRVTNIQEGNSIWIVIIDNDENTDCDVRDKIWTDIKLMDPKTGAYLVWISYEDETGNTNVANGSDDNLFYWDGYIPYKGHWPGNSAGWLGGDYLEETGSDTGVFVSKRAFQIGTRENYDFVHMNTHVICNTFYPGGDGVLSDFLGGGFFYEGTEGNRVYPGANMDLVPVSFLHRNDFREPFFPDQGIRQVPDVEEWLVGRFENMDSLVGMYQDQNDDRDVAVAMMKIIDTEASISWGQEIYKDANAAATITIVDPDENLDCSQVEYVPVFIIVNPGSWNPVQTDSPTSFCSLLRTGGVFGDGPQIGEAGNPDWTVRWYNIYHSQMNAFDHAGARDGRYYIEYDPALFAPANQCSPVLFYAQETGVDTGVFQLNLNSILTDLRFDHLNVRDVLVAYYLDPNDFDDFKLATAYIEEKQHSITSFTDASRADKDEYWIGRDPVYVQVIDANANVDPCCSEQVVVHICDPHGEDDSEWLILDETSSNSPVFFLFAGAQLWPVWDALGVGIPGMMGGFQLQLDNWKIETFNEDDMYARYNDVDYEMNEMGLAGLGDIDDQTAFPPMIDRVRVANDVGFDLMSIADTQVYDGSSVNMFFLDRQGNRVTGYVNSDCVFIEVIDADQDEDQYRRERIDAFWDQGQGGPIGPMQLNEFGCDTERRFVHPWNQLFGDTNVFNNSPADSGSGWRYVVETAIVNHVNDAGWVKVYVANPRTGRWAPVDLLETGVATGDFVSVICIDLTNVYECVPTLGVLPGDTILAVYQDPSNHSDSAWISIKVGIGGGGTPPSQQSTTMFVDAWGNEVANYSESGLAHVYVIDPSHAGATLLSSAVEIDGIEYDVTATDAADTFMTAGLNLGLTAGQTITAEYTDPTDLTDTSSDTITVIASALVVDGFYAGPNPFEGEVTFGFNGTGIATTMSAAVYNLAGGLVWETTQTDVSEITWHGTAANGAPFANGCYIYVITATDGTNAFNGTGKVFVNR